MKFLTYRFQSLESRAGVLSPDESRIIDLTALLKAPYPISDIGDLLHRYDEAADTVRAALTAAGSSEGISVPVHEVTLLAPILCPPVLGDFCAYESHVTDSGHTNGGGVPNTWYQYPLFYYQNPTVVQGPDATVYRKKGSVSLDFEAEVAFVVGKPGIDIPADERALEHIFGFTIMNDWSDRDCCNHEAFYLGLHHGKDTATGLGPYIVTLDEVADCIHDGKLDLKVDGWLDDEHLTDARTGSIYWDLPHMLSYASEDTMLVPGQVMGFGTVGSGCLYEKPGAHPYVQDGQTYTLKTERLGTLRMYVGKR